MSDDSLTLSVLKQTSMFRDEWVWECNPEQLQETNPTHKGLWVHVITTSEWSESLMKPSESKTTECTAAHVQLFLHMHSNGMNTALSLSYWTWFQVCFDSPPTPTFLTFYTNRLAKLCPKTELLVSICEFCLQALVRLE